MDDFRGETAQYDRLRAALRKLHEVHNIKSSALAAMELEEALRLGTNNSMGRTRIDKFRKGDVKKPHDFRDIYPLWNVVFSPNFKLPTADHSGPALPEGMSQNSNGLHEFFYSSVTFFRVDQHGQARAKTDLSGRFVFYHFSEYFHKFSTEVPRAVVVGQWDIEFLDGACCVAEKQAYDGNLGKLRARDRYSGYCLPKGPNLCFIMRQAKKETPKFYMLEAAQDDPDTLLTEVLAGHMLKGSDQHKFFHSPVYAERVPDAKDVQCNILPCSGVPAHVMQELEALANR